MTFHDSGWTMETFMAHEFGSERVLEMATMVEEAQHVADRLVAKRADEALRRALRWQLRELREFADANRWVKEGDIAATLADFPITPNDLTLTVHQVRSKLQLLQRLVQDRLARAVDMSGLVPA